MRYPNNKQELLLVPPTDLTPYEAGLTMPSIALQTMIINFAEQATRLYCRNSGLDEVPERFVQTYCAIALMKLGFVVTIETNARQFQEWFRKSSIEPLADRFAIDMIVYAPALNTNPDCARPRAFVEFKKNCWEISDDIQRTADFLKRVSEHRTSDTDCMFGLVVACGTSSNDVEGDIEAARGFSRNFKAERFYSRAFTESLANGYQFAGYVVGVACGQAVCSIDADLTP